MSSDTATFETARGPRATQLVESVDAIEPLLMAFVRGAARWLDPWFPQRGMRAPAERGQWIDDQKVENFVQQVEELDLDKRGLRIIRLSRAPAANGLHEGAIRIVAVGLADGAELELRWNFSASETEVHGTSAELTVDGPHKQECVTDFRCWFG